MQVIRLRLSLQDLDAKIFKLWAELESQLQPTRAPWSTGGVATADRCSGYPWPGRGHAST